MNKNNKEMIREKARIILREYILDKIEIENIKLEIEDKQNNYDLNAMSYEEKAGSINKISSVVENIAINKDPQLLLMMKNMSEYNKKCLKVENSLKLLSEFERKVIESKYLVYPKNWYTVSRELGYTEIACKRAEGRALDKLSKILLR